MGFQKLLPLLIFLGRGNRTSDLVGEKVNETHLSEILSYLLRNEEMPVEMMFIRPKVLSDAVRYILYIGYEPSVAGLQSLDTVSLASKLEALLKANPFYLQALQTGQLLPLECQLLKPGFKAKLENLYREKKQIKDGDIKIPLLFMANELSGLNHLL
jgi:hypothetical protein